MTRPTKFEMMRRNRSILRVARLREEARGLGYDEDEFMAELREGANRELGNGVAKAVAPSIGFGRRLPKQKLPLLLRWLYAMGWA